MPDKLENLIVKKTLGPEALKQFESGEISKKNLENILPEILRLSENYNFPDKQTATKLASKASVEAYMLYFMPINYFKLIWLLEKIKLNKNQKYKVLDFGCGPGSGAIAAAEYLGSNAVVSLFDISNNASQYAKELVNEYSPETKCRIAGMEWKTEKYDLIIAANSINEIKDSVKENLLKDLSGSLSDNGILLILEPALKIKTRQAMQSRDTLLGLNNNLSVIYPCTHNNSCPMLKDSEEDWCHGSISWNGSALVRQIDKLTGFNKHRLKYSAFVFKNGRTEQQGFRVVSIPQKNKIGFSATLCGDKFYSPVSLAKRDRSDKNRIFEKADLLDKVLVNPDPQEKISKETEILIAE